MKIKLKNYARHLWLSLLLLVGVAAIAVPGLNGTNSGYVARIGSTEYATLQEAVDAAQQLGGSQTIYLIDNVSEGTVTIQEVANFKLTISGQKDASSNYTVDAVIVVDGLRGNGGSTANGASVTLQNLAFVKTTATDGIQASHYPHHLTIQDCTYIGSDNDKWFLNASVDCPLYGVTVKNVTVENARLIYANLADDAVFQNITATNECTVGFNVKTSGTALIENCQVTTGKYAFRDYSDAYEGTFTLKNNTFNSTSSASSEGVIVNRGGAEGTAHINVVSGSYLGQIVVNKEGILAISEGTTFSQPVDDYIASGLISHNNGDGTYTVQVGSYVAQVGTAKYETFAEAVAAAQNGETIELLDNAGTYTMSEGQTLKVKKNGKSITVKAPDGFVLKSSTANEVTTYTLVEADYMFTNSKTGAVTYYQISSLSAFNTDGTFKLLKDATRTTRTVSSATAGGTKIIFDLNGHTLTYTSTDASFLLSGIYGEESKPKFIEIVDNSETGGGKLVMNGEIEVTGRYYDVTIGKGITIEGNSVLIDSKYYNKLTVEGTINGGNNFAVVTNGNAENANITIKDGAVLTSTGTAMYLPAKGTTTIEEGAKITGSTGIYVKSGTLNITGGEITGNGEKKDYQYWDNGCHSTGDALVVDNCGYPGGNPVVSVSGGTFTSTNAEAIASYNYGENAKLGGFVSGGYFSNHISDDLCIEGKAVIEATDKPGYFTIGDPTYVAQIGETKYVSLQAAVDAAHEMTGDVTITLIDNIEGYSIVHQKAGLNLTIDGVDKTLAGQIFIDGDGRASGTETLTIQNIKFEDDLSNFYSGTDAFVLVPSTKDTGKPYTTGKYNYAHNITISDCSFNSTAEAFKAVGFKSNSGAGCYNIVMSNVTGNNLHSLAQLTGTTGATFDNCSATLTGSFIGANGGGGTYTVSNCTFESHPDKADGYAYREKSSSTAFATLTNNNFNAFDAIILGSAGTINVESGTYIGNVSKTAGNIVISGGQFSVDLTDTTYEPFIAEGKIGVQNNAVEAAPYSVEDGTYVAQVTLGESTHKYGSLEAAFAAAADGSTVKLLDDCVGNGIVVPQGKYTTGLTVDFDNHTYTVDGETVGSTGTETNGFQLLKDNTITFKNGTITSTKAKILVQNYSNLTLEGMTLTLNNENYNEAYTLSNNNGNVVIDGTTINANPAGGFAFDVCRYSSYESVSVTVTGDSEINGNVEVYASGSDAKNGFSLMLESGNITGNIVIDATARAAIEATPDKAVIKENDSFNQAEPAGFKWVSNGDGTSTLTPMPYVAQIGDVKYWSLVDAVAAVPADGTETTIVMIADESIDVVGSAITISATKNVILDLNGFQVVGTASAGNTSALVTNNGTLTIKDSSDTNKDGTGTGKLMSGADPTWTWDGSDNYAGSYASNTIDNRGSGTLIIESGYIKNLSTGSAAYAIDNYNAGNVTINGGKVDATRASAIRMFYVNGGSISVNGGVIGHNISENDRTLYGIQFMDNAGDVVNVSVTGGTIAGYFAFYAKNSGGSIAISGGEFDGYVGFADICTNDLSISGGSFNSWVGTYGDHVKFISGGIYAEEVAEEYIADGCILSTNTDPATKDAYPYIVKQGKFICAIGTTKYETLADAVAAAGTAETTITLLTEAATDGVISGNGVVVPSGSNITFDLNGLTYDVSGETVGSSGTETSGFQLLQGSNITFKNGTLKATSPTAQMLIQNYSNLTLEDVTIDGTGLSGWAYALSNNCGTINLTGSTSITAKTGGRAFDTCKYGSYAIPTVNINTTGTITGPIEATGGKLNIENGQFNVTWVTDNNYTAGDIQITGGIFTAEPAEEYCAEGYVVTDNEDDETKATYPYAVMSKEDAGIFELVDGEIYPYLDYVGDREAASVTYKRNFKNTNWQALFIPFDINDITELTDRYEFAKIHMVALENDGTFTTGDKIEIYYTRINSGKISANQPYLIKAKNTGWQDIVVENTILKDTHNMTPRRTSTMAAEYIFTGTYEGYTGQKQHDFMAMGSGTINWGNTGHSVGTYRWYIKVEPYDDNYAKPSIIFAEADEEATSISATSTDENAEIEGYYSVNGVRSDVPVKGMNIVKYKNGKTKKIMIK